MFFLFLLKILIVGTRLERPFEAVLTSTHNLCFGSKIRKISISLYTPVYLIKMGCTGLFISQTWFFEQESCFISLSFYWKKYWKHYQKFDILPVYQIFLVFGTIISKGLFFCLISESGEAGKAQKVL